MIYVFVIEIFIVSDYGNVEGKPFYTPRRFDNNEVISTCNNVNVIISAVKRISVN